MDMDEFLDQHTKQKAKPIKKTEDPVKQVTNIPKIQKELEMTPKTDLFKQPDNMQLDLSDMKKDLNLDNLGFSNDDITKLEEKKDEPKDDLMSLKSDLENNSFDAQDLDELSKIGSFPESTEPNLDTSSFESRTKKYDEEDEEEKSGGFFGTLKNIFGGKKKKEVLNNDQNSISDIAKDELDLLSEKSDIHPNMGLGTDLKSNDLEQIGDLNELTKDESLLEIGKKKPDQVKDEFDLKQDMEEQMNPPAEQMPKPEEPMDDITKIKHLITEAHLAISEQNMNLARNKYIELNQIYENIPNNSKEKNVLYHDILELYNSILK